MLPQRSSLVRKLNSLFSPASVATVSIGFNRWRLTNSSQQLIEGTYESNAQLSSELGQNLLRERIAQVSILFDSTVVAICVLDQSISLSLDGRYRYAQHCLRPIIGADIDNWQLTIDDTNSNPAFCSAIKKSLLKAALSACTQAGAQCDSARPTFIASICKRRAPKRVTLFFIDDIQSYHGMYWAPNTVPVMLAPMPKSLVASRKIAESQIRTEASSIGISADATIEWLDANIGKKNE